MKKTILIVPANDAEAAMILRLAKVINLPTIISGQPHGASLDKEPNIIKKIIISEAKKVVIVEMPGVKTEKELIKKGIEVKIIDHHSYKGLNRKKNKSSLEQFLSALNLNDQKIKDLGFDPKLVLGIAILDRGFVWALQKENYTEKEIEKVLAFRKKLMRPFIDPVIEKRYEQAAREAWDKRQNWHDFVIATSHVKNGLRPFLSELIFKKFKKPVPLILDERGRNVILIQDSPEAERLFKEFGGFTFGDKGNWGYKNEPGKPKVTLVKLKAFLEKKVIK